MRPGEGTFLSFFCLYAAFRRTVKNTRKNVEKGFLKY